MAVKMIKRVIKHARATQMVHTRRKHDLRLLGANKTLFREARKDAGRSRSEDQIEWNATLACLARV